MPETALTISQQIEALDLNREWWLTPIQDNDSYDDAALVLKQVKSRMADLTALKKTVTKPMREALKAIEVMFDEPEEQLCSAEKDIKLLMRAYLAEVDQARRVEQARLTDEQAERTRKAEEKAAKLELKGKVDQADAVRESVLPVPIVVADVPKVSGISQRSVWKVEVTNLAILVHAVSEGDAPLEYLQANMSPLNAMAKALKSNAQVPGVRVYEEKTIAAGRA